MLLLSTSYVALSCPVLFFMPCNSLFRTGEPGPGRKGLAQYCLCDSWSANRIEQIVNINHICVSQLAFTLSSRTCIMRSVKRVHLHNKMHTLMDTAGVHLSTTDRPIYLGCRPPPSQTPSSRRMATYNGAIRKSCGSMRTAGWSIPIPRIYRPGGDRHTVYRVPVRSSSRSSSATIITCHGQ